MPVGSEEEAPLGDFIEDAEAMSAENAVIAELLHTDIRSVLATLDEREHQVIRLRFGLDDGQPRTLDQIGKLFGLSRERVRQIERDVMSKLRHGERADRLRSYAAEAGHPEPGSRRYARRASGGHTAAVGRRATIFAAGQVDSAAMEGAE